jgi:hypothetical protein
LQFSNLGAKGEQENDRQHQSDRENVFIAVHLSTSSMRNV